MNISFRSTSEICESCKSRKCNDCEKSKFILTSKELVSIIKRITRKSIAECFGCLCCFDCEIDRNSNGQIENFYPCYGEKEIKQRLKDCGYL